MNQTRSDEQDARLTEKLMALAASVRGWSHDRMRRHVLAFLGEHHPGSRPNAAALAYLQAFEDIEAERAASRQRSSVGGSSVSPSSPGESPHPR